MTISPSRRGVPRASRGSLAGKDSTLVVASLERQSRLSARIAESSVSTIASSPWIVDTMDAASSIARRSSALRLRCAVQSGDATTMSTLSGARGRRTGGRVRRVRTTNVISLPRARGLERRLVVGVDNACHELVPDDVLGGVDDVTNSLDVSEESRRFREARGLSGRQIDLARIAGDDHAAVLAESREKHLHLHRGRILRLIEDDDCVRERASAHESERRDLDLAGLQRAFDDARIHQIVERVVDRAQIRIDLLAH